VRGEPLADGSGVLVPEAVLDASELHRQVAALAAQHALQCHRSTTVEDLRKGCTARIVRRFQSVKDFDNRQFDRLLVVFRLLVNPDDLQAVMEWTAFEEYDAKKAAGIPAGDDPGARKRLVKSIHLMLDGRYAYLHAILRDQHLPSDWESLDLWRLRQLANTIRARSKKWHKPIEEPMPANEPF
jgi:hypothetical protein